MDSQSVRTKGEDLATGLLGNLFWIPLTYIDKVDKLLDQLVQLSKNNLSNYINAVEKNFKLAVSLVIDPQIASGRANVDGCVHGLYPCLRLLSSSDSNNPSSFRVWSSLSLLSRSSFVGKASEIGIVTPRRRCAL